MESEEKLLQQLSQINRTKYQQRISDQAAAEKEQQFSTIIGSYDSQTGLMRLEDVQGKVQYGDTITNASVGKGETVRVRSSSSIPTCDSLPQFRRQEIPKQPVPEIGKFKILFSKEEVVKDENNVEFTYINFYVGGDKPLPRLIYGIRKNDIDDNTLKSIIGYVHNYGSNFVATIKYYSKSAFVPVIVQITGKEKFSTNPDPDQNKDYEYFFNEFNNDVAYKGNLIWESRECEPFASLAASNFSYSDSCNNTTTNDYEKSPTPLLSCSGTRIQTYTGTSGPYCSLFTEELNDNYSATSINVVLNGNKLIPNHGTFTRIGHSSEDTRLPNNAQVFSYENKKNISSYLIDQNFNTTVVVKNYISSELIPKSNNKYYYYIDWELHSRKLFMVNKSAYIVESVDYKYGVKIDTQESYANQILARNQIDATQRFYLQTAQKELPLKSNTGVCFVQCPNKVNLTEETKAFSFKAETFIRDEINLKFYPGSDYINKPILFAQVIDANTHWFAHGNIQSMTVSGEIYLDDNQRERVYGTATVEITVNITDLKKVPFVSFSSENGTLLTHDGSFFNYLISRRSKDAPPAESVYLPSDGSVIYDISSTKYSLEYIQSVFYAYPLIFAPFYNRGALDNNLSFCRDTFLNNSIYICSIDEQVKTKKIKGYAEEWKINEDGEIYRIDSLRTGTIYSLKAPDSTIHAISYHP